MVYLDKMEKMFTEAKYKELKEFCAAQLSIYSEDVDLLFFYASALDALGEYEVAKNFFTKLFNITKDRLFLICESIPDFAIGNRDEALAELEKAVDEESDPNKLFLAFKIAVQNSEVDVGSRVLYKCFKNNPKRAMERLQELFESVTWASTERRIFFISVLSLLRELSK